MIYEKVVIKSEAYNPANRSAFSLFEPPKYPWYECRDYVHSRLWKNPVLRKTHQISMTFKFGTHLEMMPNTPRPETYQEAGENVARLLDYVERERMGWADRSEVHLTQYENAIFIKLSSGWFQNTQACSLATIFLRLGPYCRKGTEFNWLLDQYTYSCNTKPAINRFLAGYHHYTGPDLTDWYNRFKGLTKVETILIRRENVEHFAREQWEAMGKPAGTEDDCWFFGCNKVNEMIQKNMPLKFQ